MADTPHRRKFVEPIDWAVLASVLVHCLILALRFGLPGENSQPGPLPLEPLSVTLDDSVLAPEPLSIPLPPTAAASTGIAAEAPEGLNAAASFNITVLRAPDEATRPDKTPSDATVERKAGSNRVRKPVMTADQGSWRTATGAETPEAVPNTLAEAAPGKSTIMVPEDELTPAAPQPELGAPELMNNTPVTDTPPEPAPATRADTAALAQAEIARQAAENAAAEAAAEAAKQAEQTRLAAEAAEAAAKRAEEQTKAEQARKIAEQQAAERQKADAQARQLAEAAAQQQAEAAAQARQAQQAVAEKLRVEEQARQAQIRLTAEQLARKQAEEAAKAEQTRQALQAAAEQQKAEALARQKAEALARAEQQRQLAEQQAAAEQRRAEAAAAQRRQEEAARAAQAAAAQRQAEAAAEQARRQASAATRSPTGNGTGTGTGRQADKGGDGSGTPSGLGITLPIEPPVGLSLTERALQQARQGNLRAEKPPSSGRGRIANYSQAAAAAEPELRFYAESLNIKLNRIGALNAPRLSADRFYRPVQLTIIVNSDGSLADILVRHSSGDSKLDDAARRIVQMSLPFAPFPAGMQERYDRIEIGRNWDFGAGTAGLLN
ncbi:TonB family protein [Chitinimonas viridis]|uniref:TonB family protein n=1 Tax=Chitinimonas viridis TaxID=664880 RepID=A0ABT8AZJ7_9NEIS|nr:TonB family protein [Chitinimonas viridis]MDN3575239.1 TonB family protein [Chitinimonas viridis]